MSPECRRGGGGGGVAPGQVGPKGSGVLGLCWVWAAGGSPREGAGVEDPGLLRCQGRGHQGVWSGGWQEGQVG